MIDLSNDEVKI